MSSPIPSSDPNLSAFIAEVSLALIRGGDISVVLDHCAAILVRHLEVAFARIWILNQEEQVLELQASAGMYTHKNGQHSRIPVGAHEIGKIAKERLPHLSNAVIGNPRIHDQEWARRERMVAFAGYPLLIEDRLVGVMGTFARHPLPSVTLEIMGSLANVIALAVDHQRAEDALAQREADLARLTARIENIREEERAQVAREIHDELGAVLSLLKIKVASIQKRTKHDTEVLDKTQNILDQLDHAIRTIQRIAKDLRPSLLDHFGLGAAIEEYVDTNCHRDTYVCEKDIDMNVVIDSLRATAIFRVFQEAITNILRHAKASKILVCLKQDGTHITLIVDDNGIGIERGQVLRRDALGLIGMRERVRPFWGTVSIVGRPSQGTRVTVLVPNSGRSLDNP